MRILTALLLSVASLFGQGANTFGLRNPSSLMAMHQVFTSNQVRALNPVMWLMAGIGCYSDSGITPCVNGDRVQQWKDQSGSGNDVGRDTVAQQPHFFTSSINGFPAVAFGTDTFNLLTNKFTAIPDPVTIFIVLFPSNALATPIYNGFVNGGPQLNFTGNIAISEASALVVQDLSMRQKEVWYCLSCVYYTNKSAIYLNSKLRASGILTTNYNEGFWIGGTGGGGSLAKCRIAEMIVCQGRLLSTEERYGVEMYLKLKYALPDPF